MFSDRFTEVEKYSILRQEHICSSSTMPWLYTGLVQDRYEPTLPSPIADRLNAALDFTPFVTEESDPPRNELKKLTIDYVGDTHIGYDSVFVRRVADIVTAGDKKHFKVSTQTTHLIRQYEEMFAALIPDTNPMFAGFKHDDEGVATHVGVSTNRFNFSSSSDVVVNIARYLNLTRNWTKSKAYFGEESLNFVIGTQFTNYISETVDVPNVVRIKRKIDKKIRIRHDQTSDKHILALIKAGLLTEDQARYVYSVLPGFDGEVEVMKTTDIYGQERYIHPYPYMLDFEYVIKDGVLDDIILYRFKYKGFKEIEVEK